MIDLKTAFEKVRAAFFQGKVPETIYEYRDFWVFDWKEDCECASMPAVWKESGEVFLFFLPISRGRTLVIPGRFRFRTGPEEKTDVFLWKFHK